jgi:hypothetical protein
MLAGNRKKATPIHLAAVVEGQHRMTSEIMYPVAGIINQSRQLFLRIMFINVDEMQFIIQTLVLLHHAGAFCCRKERSHILSTYWYIKEVSHFFSTGTLYNTVVI